MDKMKRTLSVFLTMILCLSVICIPAAAKKSPLTITDGIYVLRSGLDENMVLDISGGAKKAGGNVQLYRYNGTTSQMFWIERVGNSNRYTITALNSGMVLDVAGGNQKSGTNVQQYKANGSDAQKWHFYSAGKGYHYIASEGELALDVSGGAKKNGTNVQIYKPNSTYSQAWKLERVAAPKEKTSYKGAFSSSACAVVKISEDLINKNGKQNATVKLKVYNYKNKAYDGEVVVTFKDMAGKTIWSGVKKGGDTLKLGDDYAAYKIYVTRYTRTANGNIIHDTIAGADNFMAASDTGWGLEKVKNGQLYSL